MSAYKKCRYVNCWQNRYNRDWCLTHFSLLPHRPCVECGSATKHPDGWCLHCRVESDPRDDGYVRVSWQGRMVGLHRIVMQEALGRPLFRDENVHHINGDRADNRLENLELWSTSQPAGQRVEDKVEWAQMILTRYGHLESSQAT